MTISAWATRLRQAFHDSVLASDDRFSRHATWSLIRHVTFAISIALAYPFFLRRLGAGGYGVWVLAASISNYLQATDLGFGVALVHYVASDHLRGSHGAIWQRLIASSIMFGCAGVVVLSLLAWLVPGILAYAGLRAEELAIGVSATRLMLLAAFLRVLSTFPSAVLSGIGEMAVSYKWDVGGLVVGTLAMCSSVLLRGGILGLAYSSFIGPLVLLAGTFLSIRRRLVLQSPPDLIPIWQHFRELVAYGAQVQVASLASIAIHPLSRVFVSRFGDLSQVSALDFAEKLVLGLRGVLVAALVPAIPAAARTRTSLLETTRRRIARVGKAIRWGVAPAAIALSLLSGPLLRVWLGTSVDLAFGVFTIRVYLVAYVINIFFILPFFTMQGAGYAAGPMYSQIFGGTIAVFLAMFLGSALGARGVVLGVSLGVLAACLVIWLSFRSWTERIEWRTEGRVSLISNLHSSQTNGSKP